MRSQTRRTGTRPARVCALAAFVLLVGSAPATHAQAPVPVTVAPVQAGGAGVAPLELSGTFTAKRRSLLSPAVAGQVAVMAVDVGDRVAAGDVLLRLDDTLATLTLQRLQAARREAAVRLTDARRLADEARALAPSGNVSQSVAATRAADANAAAAALASRSAELAEQEEVVRRHILRAPYAGVIARRTTDAGAWAVPGAGVLELVDTDALRLDIPVPQARFAQITAQTAVVVRTPAVPDAELDARIETVVPVSDPAARTLQVRLTVDNASRRILPGMSATAAFDLPGADGVVRVPRDALIRRPDGSVGVWIVEDDDGLRARVRRVDLGRTQGQSAEIRGGLAADARVVVRGNEALTDGQRVRLVSPTGQADTDGAGQ